MASDILLYQTDLVPIGADQKQHLEICRDIAERFNGVYGDVFTIPEGYFPKVGARVMSLQEPTRKMSKSDPEETYIAILDKPDVIRKKIRRAVTDCDSTIRFDPEEKPGVANLMSIMSALSGKGMDDIANEYDGQGYGKFKDAVADSVIAALEPIQSEYERISADKAYLQQVMDSGRDRASAIAHRTMLKVRKKLGIAPWKL
jgi:tryptophanyl-tRNA synthetase